MKGRIRETAKRGDTIAFGFVCFESVGSDLA